eukprot:4254583-Pleurochrysis_carterae.AAC.1
MQKLASGLLRVEGPALPGDGGLQAESASQAGQSLQRVDQQFECLGRLVLLKPGGCSMIHPVNVATSSRGLEPGDHTARCLLEREQSVLDATARAVACLVDVG